MNGQKTRRIRKAKRATRTKKQLGGGIVGSMLGIDKRPKVVAPRDNSGDDDSNLNYPNIEGTFDDAAAPAAASAAAAPPPATATATPTASPAERGRQLLTSIMMGEIDRSLELIRAGADLTVDGRSALFEACDEKRPEVALAILERPGVEIDFRGLGGKTPLMAASKRGLTDVVRVLLSKGADLEATDSHTQNALELSVYYAWDHNNPDIMLFLLKAGTFVRKSRDMLLTSEIDTPPFAAVKAALEATPVINEELLHDMVGGRVTTLEKNAAINLGELLLDSIKIKQTMESHGLFRRGADLTVRDGQARTPLALACLYPDVMLAAAITMFPGVDLNATDSGGSTPLMLACIRNLPPVVDCLLGQGADMKATNMAGATALEIAIRMKHATCALLLIRAGADVNAGRLRPLILSEVYEPHMVAVEAALVAHGATAVGGNRRKSRKKRQQQQRATRKN